MFNNLRIFRDSIEPLWEVPENKDGGKIVIILRNKSETKVESEELNKDKDLINLGREEESYSKSRKPRVEIPEVFKLCLCLIFMEFLGPMSYFSGCVLSIRAFGSMISIWLSSSTNSEIAAEISSKLSKLTHIDMEIITYKKHTDTIKNNVKNLTKKEIKKAKNNNDEIEKSKNHINFEIDEQTDLNESKNKVRPENMKRSSSHGKLNYRIKIERNIVDVKGNPPNLVNTNPSNSTNSPNSTNPPNLVNPPNLTPKFSENKNQDILNSKSPQIVKQLKFAPEVFTNSDLQTDSSEIKFLEPTKEKPKSSVIKKRRAQSANGSDQLLINYISLESIYPSELPLSSPINTPMVSLPPSPPPELDQSYNSKNVSKYFKNNKKQWNIFIVILLISIILGLVKYY